MSRACFFVFCWVSYVSVCSPFFNVRVISVFVCVLCLFACTALVCVNLCVCLFVCLLACLCVH